MDVPPGDLLLINKVLSELYSAPTPEEHIQAMLRVLAELVPSDLIENRASAIVYAMQTAAHRRTTVLQ